MAQEVASVSGRLAERALQEIRRERLGVTDDEVADPIMKQRLLHEDEAPAGENAHERQDVGAAVPPPLKRNPSDVAQDARAVQAVKRRRFERLRLALQ